METTRMEWASLLSVGRLGQEQNDNKSAENRTAFERDYDRIIFSSAFRRLQNKTQVFPMPETDFIHTRLTHSLETSSIGRSLGKLAGDEILEFERGNPLFDKEGINSSHVAAIVAAAALAHDIGNPPFGHSGEDAISDFFRSQKAQPFIESLSEKQLADLQKYEGNALGFRKLTATYPELSEVSGGLQLCYATLGAFTKYPKESLPAGNKAMASEKKFGFFQSEREIFRIVAEKCGLVFTGSGNDYKWKRHPLAFLMEAADDICYHVIDLEDGFNLGVIGFEETETLLFVSELEDRSRYEKIKDKREKIGYLRAKAIQKLVAEVTEVFSRNYDGIMDGNYDRALTKDIASAAKCEKIISVSREKIYNFHKVLEIEAAGFEVIGGLLELFLESSIFRCKSKHGEKVLGLLPAFYLVEESRLQENIYEQIMNICDFIAGMTDNSAIGLYRKLKGISLPEMR